MINIDKENVRDSSFIKLFDTVMKYESLTRAQIVRESRLSAVTVTRVLDSLLDSGILIQQNDPENSSDIFTLGKFADYSIIDLSDGDFSLYGFSSNQQPEKIFSREIQTEFGFEEEFSVFLSNIKRKRIDLAEKCLIISPVPNPDNFNISGRVFPEIPDETVIPELISSIFPDSNVKTIGRDIAVHCGAVYNKENAECEIITYICADNLFYALNVQYDMIDTDPFYSYGAGFIKGTDGRSILRTLSEIQSADHLITPLATVISSIMAIISPDKIVISSGRFRINEGMIKAVKRIICEQADPCFGLTYDNLPLITFSRKPLHIQGAAKLMIKNDFEIILNHSK